MNVENISSKPPTRSRVQELIRKFSRPQENQNMNVSQNGLDSPINSGRVRQLVDEYTKGLEVETELIRQRILKKNSKHTSIVYCASRTGTETDTESEFGEFEDIDNMIYHHEINQNNNENKQLNIKDIKEEENQIISITINTDKLHLEDLCVETKLNTDKEIQDIKKIESRKPVILKSKVEVQQLPSKIPPPKFVDVLAKFPLRKRNNAFTRIASLSNVSQPSKNKQERPLMNRRRTISLSSINTSICNTSTDRSKPIAIEDRKPWVKYV